MWLAVRSCSGPVFAQLDDGVRSRDSRCARCFDMTTRTFSPQQGFPAIIAPKSGVISKPKGVSLARAWIGDK